MPIYVSTNQNGEIISVLRTPFLLDTQIAPQNSLILDDDAEVDLSTHYVNSTGQLTKYTTEQQTKRNQKPLYNCYWDMTRMQWIDTRTVEELRQTKYEEINKERINRNLLPIDYDNKKFDADEQSQSNLRGWINVISSGGSLPANFTWRDYNNVDHIVDANWMIGLHTSIISRTTILYEHSWSLKQELAAIPDNDLNGMHHFYTGNYKNDATPNWPGVPPANL
jgi:hypothetical protein